MDLEVLGAKVSCRKCEREILVERGMMGTNHTIAIMVICWECLTDEQQQKVKDYYKFTDD